MTTFRGTILDDTLTGGPGNDFMSGFSGDDMILGGDGSDQLLGGAGDDTLDGGAEADTLRAGNGDDTLVFNLADRVTGSAWDAYDGGSGGTDTLQLNLTAAEWSDGEINAQIMDFLDELAANPGGSVNYRFSSLNLRVTNIEAVEIWIDGQLWTPGPQVIDLSGSTADETVTITASAGGMVTTGAGNDTITGGPGNDTIVSGSGNDQITLGDGDDVALAGSGNDTIIAGQAGGNDFIDGGTGNDTVAYPSLLTNEPVVIDLNLADRSADPVAAALLVANGLAATTPVGLANGGAWVDTDVLISIENAIGGAGDDTITGDGAANLLDGQGGADLIDSGAGDDTIYGRAGNDTLNGGLDDDTIAGGAGDDRIDGGGGFDTLVLAGNSADYTVTVLGNGLYSFTDNGSGGDGIDVISQIETIAFADVTVGLWSLVGPLVVNGTSGNDTLPGTAARERFYGFDGDDLITGGQEEDQFIGGAGNDTLDGGGPQDPTNQDDLNFVWDSLNYDDEYWQAVNAGVMAQGVVVNLATGVATDTYGDTDTVIEIERVYGTPLADSITGSDADEAFDPHGGADTIDGGAGWDSLHYHLTDGYYGGGTSGISIQFSATVAGDGTVIDPLGDTDVFFGIEAVRGTLYDDTFAGGVGTQQFRGYDGSDMFDGGAGFAIVAYHDDANYGGNGGISFDLSITDAQGFASVTDGFGNADKLRNIDQIRGTGSTDDMRGDAADNTFLGDAGDDYLAGAGGIDNLVGGLGDDTLDGGADGDALNGNAGMDILTGGTGDDTLAGGLDSDQFIFFAGDGADRIDDFEVGLDHLVLVGGLTVTGLSESDVNGDGGLDTTVDLSSGDSIVLLHVADVTNPLQLF
ncbi:MAG: hypothetical protein B7Z02_07575 [Rhodobacterales bacterium 32-67-9]|nr:MAG: hypothetical protein B7Z02_07575 [Rhodobacterales bacterium 32-67-9]